MPIRYSISVVSHCSGNYISELFHDFNDFLTDEHEILLTINVPEDESYIQNLAFSNIKIFRNKSPKGYGENHNNAFSHSSGCRFVVINPDIRIKNDIFKYLDSYINQDIFVCAPLVLNASGLVEDSVRNYPSLLRIFKRVVLGNQRPDYTIPDDKSPISVDWAAGMFLFFNSNNFKDLNGFDTSYFMYLEDVDICQRLNLSGGRVLWVPSISILHSAQRDSRKRIKYLYWHLRSMIRYLYRGFFEHNLFEKDR